MTTHLIHLPFDMRAFNRWIGQRGLVRSNVVDEGYACHILLNSLFGKSILQPFRLFASPHRNTAALYAYSNVDASELKEIAELVGTPDCLHVIHLEKLLSKQMPINFSAGQELGFDIRVRPTRRLICKVVDQQTGETFSKGAELDAFRVNTLRNYPNEWENKAARAQNKGDTRTKIYIEWLAERFSNSVQIEIVDCCLTSFQRRRCIRGTGIGFEGPDVTVHGKLTVRQSDTFASQLRNGIGRHKAYGYGMLLLRPPKSPVPELS